MTEWRRCDGDGRCTYLLIEGNDECVGVMVGQTGGASDALFAWNDAAAALEYGHLQHDVRSLDFEMWQTVRRSVVESKTDW